MRRLVGGALKISPHQHGTRARLFADYGTSELAAVGIILPTGRHGLSVSERGSLRGIHYTIPTEARYVTCTRGAVWDVIVDIRPESATFRCWDSVLLDDESRLAVYIPAGLGHGFMALTDDATMTYLCGRPYDPDAERAINPLDPQLGIMWPRQAISMSERDRTAPTLAEALQAGWLPES